MQQHTQSIVYTNVHVAHELHVCRSKLNVSKWLVQGVVHAVVLLQVPATVSSSIYYIATET